MVSFRSAMSLFIMSGIIFCHFFILQFCMYNSRSVFYLVYIDHSVACHVIDMCLLFEPKFSRNIFILVVHTVSKLLVPLSLFNCLRSQR